METEFVKLAYLHNKKPINKTRLLSLCKEIFYAQHRHFMGIDTHDVGDRDVIFEEGMVASCEPGIYIPEEESSTH